MYNIVIKIEKSDDWYWAYSESEEGILGGGKTLEECKSSISDCIETMKLFDHPPEFLLKPYNLIYLT